MTKMFKVSLKKLLFMGSASPVKVVGYIMLGLLVITFWNSLVKMMIPNQELIPFLAILVKMMITNQELIMIMISLSSTTKALMPNPKHYIILVN